jgi:hypothetical protein
MSRKLSMKKEAKTEEATVVTGWVAAAKNFSPGALREQENAQFERAKLYDEHAKRFNFVLGGKLHFEL